MEKIIAIQLSCGHLLEAFGEVLKLMLQLNRLTLSCSSYN